MNKSNSNHSEALTCFLLRENIINLIKNAGGEGILTIDDVEPCPHGFFHYSGMVCDTGEIYFTLPVEPCADKISKLEKVLIDFYSSFLGKTQSKRQKLSVKIARKAVKKCIFWVENCINSVI